MKRHSLLALLRQHTPFDPEEHAMWQDTIRFVEDNPDCFERWLTIGHVTGSAWIIDDAQTSVLLMHHRKLDKWFQPGGHADGDPDILRVAMKEAQEETGLDTVSVLSPAIFDVDVHLIPANAKEAAHYHYDIRFLLRADHQQPLIVNSESKNLVWVPLSDVKRYNNSNSLLRMVRKMGRLDFFSPKK